MLREILNTPYKYHRSDWWVYLAYGVLSGMHIVYAIVDGMAGKVRDVLFDLLLLCIIVISWGMILLVRNYTRKLDDDIEKLLRLREQALEQMMKEAKEKDDGRNKSRRN